MDNFLFSVYLFIFYIQDDSEKANKFLSDSMARLSVSTNPEQAVAQSDLVVEAIVEKLKIKQKLFKSLDVVSFWYINIFLHEVIGICL